MAISLIGRMACPRLCQFAGLLDEWEGPDGPLRSCTIITTTPNELVEFAHDRMPVILPPDAVDTWLDPTEDDPDKLQKLLVPYDADKMRRYPVSKSVEIAVAGL